MLPISKRRTIAIPHRLALIAAAICLALSFSVDRTSVNERLQAGNTPEHEAVDRTANPPIPASERVEDADNKARTERFRLLPWFSGLRP